MNCLLDTHVLIWSHVSPNKLSKDIKKILEDNENTLYVSVISLWEISLKHSLGKLSIKGAAPEEFYEYSLKAGLKIVDIDATTSVSFYKLAKFSNKDPFDRMLAWQAIQSNYVLLTQDKGFLDYQQQGLKIIL